MPGPTAVGLFTLEDLLWSWAYALVGRHGRFGYLVVGAKEEPAAGDRFVLHVLAQQAGVVLAKAHLHGRERNSRGIWAPPTSRCGAAWRSTTG